MLPDVTQETLFVLELMEYGSLYDLIHNKTTEIEESVLLSWMRDVASGLAFLHGQQPSPIVHGDIKSPKILVDAKPRAKIFAGGFAQKKAFCEPNEIYGTQAFMAPELLNRKSGHTTATDVYAFGCLLAETFSGGRDLYEEEDMEEVLAQVAHQSIRKRPSVPTGCPFVVAEVMMGCLQYHPEDRTRSAIIEEKLKAAAKDVEPAESQAIPRFATNPNMKDARTEDILLELFPRHVANALKEGRKLDPEHHEMVSVFFADIVGYTTHASELGPIKATKLLDRLYTALDGLCKKHKVFKVRRVWIVRPPLLTNTSYVLGGNGWRRVHGRYELAQETDKTPRQYLGDFCAGSL